MRLVLAQRKRGRHHSFENLKICNLSTATKIGKTIFVGVASVELAPVYNVGYAVVACGTVDEGLNERTVNHDTVGMSYNS